VVVAGPQRGAGGLEPLGGAGGALVAARGVTDQPREPAGPGAKQRVGVAAKAFQHRQVGHAELADQGAGGQQLTDQVLDAALVAGALLGEPVAGAHAAVQRRPFGAGQRQRVQPGQVDQRQPRQGVGVDAACLGLPRQHPTQVMGFGRANPVDRVPPGGEEHRDRQPGGPRRLQHDLQAGARWCSGQGGPLHLPQAVFGWDRLAAAHHAAVASQYPHGVRADDAQVDPDQPPVTHRCLLVWWPRAAPAALKGGAPRPRSQGDGIRYRYRRRLPLMCCNRPRPRRAGPLPSSGASAAGQGWQSAQRGVAWACRPQSSPQRHPRNQPGYVCNPGTTVWIKHRSPLHEPPSACLGGLGGASVKAAYHASAEARVTVRASSLQPKPWTQ
jgi:hypothetical protein